MDMPTPYDEYGMGPCRCLRKLLKNWGEIVVIANLVWVEGVILTQRRGGRGDGAEEEILVRLRMLIRCANGNEGKEKLGTFRKNDKCSAPNWVRCVMDRKKSVRPFFDIQFSNSLGRRTLTRRGGWTCRLPMKNMTWAHTGVCVSN
jgi:hypothetical protein